MLRLRLPAAAVLAAVAAALTTGAAPAAAASTCAAQGLTIAPLQSDVFYVDVQQNYLGSYVGYKLTDTSGSARTGLWERLESFSGGVVAPSSGQPATDTLPVPALAANGAAPLYSYLKASAATATPQNHDVVIYDGRPGAGGTEVCRETQTIASVADVIKAAANKVTGATVTPAAVDLGGTFNLTVTGDSGTIGPARRTISA